MYPFSRSYERKSVSEISIRDVTHTSYPRNYGFVGL
jgi:hypothetical protein